MSSDGGSVLNVHDINCSDDETISFEVGQQAKYIPLHERISRRISDKTPFFSLEFFPPKTANGVANFFTRLDRFNEGGPLFIDITWHLASDPANMNKETSSSSIAAGCLDYCRVDTMLHMTCAHYSKEQTIKHLEQSKSVGLRNILALRGDLNTDLDETPIYKYRALDMIRYPSGHPEAPSYKADLQYLKSKCDSGAQFIITQMFFEAEVFERFVRDCREIGITVPIIPGIMPIMGYDSIRRIATLSQLTIPQSILSDLEPIKHDDDAVRKYGTIRAIEMCRRILSNGAAPAVHLYTMNREGACREILQELGLWHKRPMRALPWEPHGSIHPLRFVLYHFASFHCMKMVYHFCLRCKEDVRPIFWSARPKSYIYRTRDWDDFPNGRWGNSSSPAFGDLNDYYLFHLKLSGDFYLLIAILQAQTKKEDLLKMFGEELKSFDDVKKVFKNFISQETNENGVKVTSLPWNEKEIGMQEETKLINDQLLWCNENGILTVNSQPPVNGAPSTDPLVGWGKPGGYCYQKAYLECFISKDNAMSLLEIIDDFYPRVNYHLINHDGSFDRMNGESTTPIAVTWGVFPGAEVAQPTVVDPLAFRAWKDEAYDAWIKSWANLYPKDSYSRKIIQKIYDDFLLLNLVDNDFQKPVIIYEMLEKVLKRTEERNASNCTQVEL
ncbi:putative methylenetetrahydrofolate reductase [Dictyocaulus viviparus]|uniref:Putative methylenetetrahydrofolate reductase n=1 Tax=Dictyocaulus viviparus TaxID=29172 RepID=A0A0D8XM92_DICVI|nr:putative methylenetetrahydrofolate reductase [Dictyocaulus viviparus]